MAEQIKSVQDFDSKEPLAVIITNQQHLLKQFHVLAENQKVLLQEIQQMDSAWRNGVYDEPTPIEAENGVDSYPFREQFEQLCRDVSELGRKVNG